MTFDEIRRAGELADAYEGALKVRTNLAALQTEDDMWLKVAAFEGDASGGVYHGSSLIPIDLAHEILDRTLDALGDALAKLGVDPPSENAVEAAENHCASAS